MKLLKKISLMSLIAVMVLIMSGCGSKNVEGTLEELMTKVYKDIPEDERPMMLSNIEVTDENVEYYLGTSDIEYEEALASEPMIGSIAHSVVLVRVKNDADIESIKTKIKENVNPRKWVCVGVEEDEVVVKNKGNLIILIMSSNNREKLEKGFDSL